MHDRRVTRWARAVAAAVACVVLLAGCASSTGLVSAPGTEFHLAQIEHARPSQPTSVAIERVTAAPINGYDWTVASVDPASDRVEISWIDGGDPRCGEADRLQVAETDRAVIIGVVATHRDPELFCTLEGHPRRQAVHLLHPLGRRALLEATTGVNDGLPTVSSPSSLPDPRCSTLEGSASDVPVGMPDVTARMAPTTAARAFVCRTWWPKGSAHAEATTITDAAKARALVRAVNAGVRSPHSAADPEPSCTKSRGSWYDLNLQGDGVRVEVKTDEISCHTITNGSLAGTMTPVLERTLDALFPA